MRIFRLLLDVRHDGSDGLDDGDDERSEGRSTGVVEERRLYGGKHRAASDCALVTAEVPRGDRHRNHDLSRSTLQNRQQQRWNSL